MFRTQRTHTHTQLTHNIDDTQRVHDRLHHLLWYARQLVVLDAERLEGVEIFEHECRQDLDATDYTHTEIQRQRKMKLKRDAQIKWLGRTVLQTKSPHWETPASLLINVEMFPSTFPLAWLVSLNGFGQISSPSKGGCACLERAVLA